MVDKLMTFLDGHSTLSLVKALPLAFDMIEGKSSWIKLVRRVCPYLEDGVVSLAEWEEQVAKEREDVRNLVEILKMMEDLSPLLLDLLHVICERFPPFEVPDDDETHYINGRIQVSCTCKEASHTLSPIGLMYLEEVERGMDTTKQKVEKVVTDDLEDPWLADLNSRLLRQQHLGVDTEVNAVNLICNSKESAEAISTLMQHCQRVDVQGVLTGGSKKHQHLNVHDATKNCVCTSPWNPRTP